MPMMPPRRCPGCRQLVPAGACLTCTREYDQRRNAAQPSRDWYRREPWLSVRRSVLSRQPLCVLCEAEGKLTVATCVDHVVPHKGDWDLFLRSDNGPEFVSAAVLKWLTEARIESALIDPGLDGSDRGFFGRRDDADSGPMPAAEAQTEKIPTRRPTDLPPDRPV